MAYSVYLHENKINKKKYVGITSLKPEERWKKGKHYEHNTHFTRAIEKYSWDNFHHNILFENLEKEKAIFLEKKLIKELDLMNPEKGYNKTSGGENFKLSEEIKLKLSKIRKGEKNSFYGKKHTDKTKKLISKNRKGKCSGNDHPMYGKSHTKEAMKKLKVSGTWSNIEVHRELSKKSILMIDKKTNKILKEFSWVDDALYYLKSIDTKGYKYTRPSIYNCIYGKTKSSFGYKWKYKEVE